MSNYRDIIGIDNNNDDTDDLLFYNEETAGQIMENIPTYGSLLFKHDKKPENILEHIKTIRKLEYCEGCYTDCIIFVKWFKMDSGEVVALIKLDTESC